MPRETPPRTSSSLAFSRSPDFSSMVVLRLLLQHRVETVENGHPAREEVVIIRRGLDETVDRQVHARGFVAGELAIVEVRLMDDLGDQLDAPVLDPEALDERLERTVDRKSVV